MSEISNIFFRAFDSSGFPARWYCGTWSSALGWLHIIADSLIFIAYMAIPFILLYFIWRRPSIPFNKIIILFAAFIICCGTGHLLEAVIFWNPIYRFAGIWKFITAMVSLATVVALIPIIPRALTVPEIFASNSNLKAALKSINNLREEQENIACNIAHFLKEPVRALNYRLSTILSEKTEQIPQSINKDLVQLRNQGEKLHKMIEQIVVHTNIISMNIELQATNITSLIKETIQSMTPKSWEYELTVCDTAPETILADSRLLTIAIEHIVNWMMLSSQSLEFQLESILLDLGKEELSQREIKVVFNFAKVSKLLNQFPNVDQVFSSKDTEQSLSIANRIFHRLGGGVRFAHEPNKNRVQLVALFKDCTLNTVTNETLV